MQLPALIASLIFAAVFAIDSLAEDLDDRSDSVSQKPIRIRVNRNALNDYYEFSQMAPENYFTLFNNRHSNREVAEVWLLKLALQKGGWNNPIKLFPGDDRYDASVALLNKGRVLMNSDSTWLGSISNLADKVYISPPLLRRGELEAGLYTAANSPLLQSAEVNVTALSSIASRFWEVDWAVLQSLNLRQLQHHDSYYYMLKAVDRGLCYSCFKPAPTWLCAGWD